MKKAALGIILVPLLVSMFAFTFNLQSVEASGTIYIRADGSIEGTTVITSSDNVTYTFTGNINDSLVIERENILIDGAGHTLQGNGSGAAGISMWNKSNVTIRNLEIKAFAVGISLSGSSRNKISGNNITNVGVYGIFMGNSTYNSVSGNNIISSYNCSIYLYMNSHYNNITRNNMTNSTQSVILVSSSNNTFSGNIVANTFIGVTLTSSSTNKFYHNTFMSSIRNAHIVTPNYTNFWDDSYPSSGNYWSDYNGTDLYSGPHQNDTGSDGIGDTPYIIDATNTDRYPLIDSYYPVGFNATKDGETYTITVVSNSTITNFNFSYPLQKLGFNATGPSNTTGYCNIILPKDLINETIVVLVNGNPVAYNMEENSTHFFVYFTYSHSTSIIEILATILGDINGDRTVDIVDIVICALAFGSEAEDNPKTPWDETEGWNPLADLNLDQIIDIVDLVKIAIHFGETW